MSSHLNQKSRHERTIQRSSIIASTLFVLLSSLLIVKIYNSWDTISLILGT